MCGVKKTVTGSVAFLILSFLITLFMCNVKRRLYFYFMLCCVLTFYQILQITNQHFMLFKVKLHFILSPAAKTFREKVRE